MAINRLKQILSGKYLRNVGWMASAEMANRLIKLSGTVILARMFSPQDYGLMAIIFTVSEFANSFTLKGGIGAKIIQVDEKDLSDICNTSYWLNWITCGSLFIIQCAIAIILPYFSYDSSIVLPLCLLSLIYLTYPLFVINLVLIERENHFKIMALCNVIVSISSTAVGIPLVLLGFGVWAIIWSMLITAPIWIILGWKYHSWRPPLRFSMKRWREVLGFGINVFGNDLLNKFRGNVDYLLVGKYLGIEALGIYYFAFNAGSGITSSLLYHFMSPLYPYICEVRNDYWQFKKRYFRSLKKISVILVPLILAQAILAPLYVPIVFGEKWVSAIPVLILICLSVIPKLYASAASLLLDAIDKNRISLYISILSTVVFVLSIIFVVQGGIVWVASVVLLNNLVVSGISTFWINRFALQQKFFINSC